MIIGLDIGSSAVKLAGLDGDKILFTHMEERGKRHISAAIIELLVRHGIQDKSIELIAATGVGAESFAQEEFIYPILLIPETQATGEGGTWLAGISEAVVASVGTGTSIVLAKNGTYSHVGGSGVGSGTLRGIAKRETGNPDPRAFFEIARGGDRKKIDIMIGDLFSGTDTLPKDLTASNLAKCRDDGTPGDWAAAIVNMVLEVAGSHAALACGGYGVDTVIVIGGVTQADIARECYEGFDRLYKPTYIIPPHSGCATAIGAARRAMLGK